MKIAYGKIGRILRFDEASNVGGDIEVINLLRRFIDAGHEVDLVTRHVGRLPNGVRSQYDPGGAFYGCPGFNGTDRLYLCEQGPESTDRLRAYTEWVDQASRTFPTYDDHVIFLGEHNGPAWPLPKKNGSGMVRPYSSRILHVWPLINTINTRKIEPLWLCPDPRNVLKCDNLDQSLIGTRPILAQYDQDLRGSRYAYAAIELLAVAHLAAPTEPPSVIGRRPFGAMINEGMKDARPLARRNLVRPWVTDLGGELVGTWRDETCAEIGILAPEPVPYARVQATNRRWRSTVSLPASCTGWATAKPWEAFVADTVCFAHPAYDDRSHVYDNVVDLGVRRFLRPRDPIELQRRVAAVAASDALWAEVVLAQREALTFAQRTWDRGFLAVRENLGRWREG